MNVEQLLQDMTLEEKIGQLFLLAFAGHQLDEARTLMQEHMIGGSYISNDNIPTARAAYQLTDTLQGYAASTRLQIPLLLGVDQEGAWGVMIPDSSPGPGNMALGATHDPRYAYEMYKVIGEELGAVGLNTLLAPASDCNSNPINSLIGMRSFGEKPELVGAMAAAAVEGAHAGGVFATAKHFPGHGDTRLDSHRELPTVDRSKEDLVAIDLYPFAQAIKAGVDIVMTGHIIFTALDPERPATLSPIILQDVLRGDLGFEGVILSDSMNMWAMKKNYDPEVSAVQALQAGVDMIMLAEEHYDHNATSYIQQHVALMNAVARAVANGELPMARVDDAVRRILTLKAKLGAPHAGLSEDEALRVVGSPEHREVELEASRHAAAIIWDEPGLIPLGANTPVALVNTTSQRSYEPLGSTRGIGPNQTTPAFDYFAQAMKRKHDVREILLAEDILHGGKLPGLQGNAVIVAVTENYPLPGVDFDQETQPQVVQALLDHAPDRLIVVALRDPYELETMPDIPTYLCTFSFRPCAAEAAAEILAGAAEAGGRTPVSVPGTDLSA